MSNELQTVKRLAVVLSALSLVLVLLGSYVRATGAGLACPDWPLCFGRVVPDQMDNGVFQEYLHRVLAGVLTLITAYFAFKAYQLKSAYPRLWSIARFAVALLVVQIVMGGLTVLMQLRPLIITLHLALGTVFLQTAAWIATEKGERSPAASASFAGAVKLFVLLTFIQIVVGGYVGSSGASLACLDFPLCNGSLFPKAGPQHLQMFHRALGFLILVHSLYLLVKGRSFSGRSRKLPVVIFAHVVLQIIVGALNVYLRIPVWVTVVHQVLAQAILFLSLSLVRELTLYSSLFVSGRLPDGGEREEHVDSLGELPA